MARRRLGGFRLPSLSWSSTGSVETPPSGNVDMMSIQSPIDATQRWLVTKDHNGEFWYAGGPPTVAADDAAFATLALTYAHLLPLGLPVYVQSTKTTYTLVKVAGSRTFITSAREGQGYRGALYYVTNGTFNKATYPWLRAVRVRCQGGGGGGGGVRSSTGRTAIGAGGSGGHYAESYIEVGSLPSGSITVTSGNGGSAGSSAAGTGGTGGTSSFGSLVIAQGGIGGVGEDADGFFGTTPRIVGGTDPNSSSPTGDLIVRGGPSHTGVAQGANWAASGAGGDSYLGHGGSSVGTVSASLSGNTGGSYGGGGSGASGAANATDRAGGAGGTGIVIVELYA